MIARISSLSLLLVYCFSSSIGQCILIKADPRDCQSCFGNIRLLDPLRTGLPAFAVYPESLADDSSDLAERTGLTKHGIQLLFSSRTYNKFFEGNDSSEVIGLDNKASVLLRTGLKTLDRDSLDDFVFRAAAKVHEPDGFYRVYSDTLEYRADIGLGIIKILSLNSGKVLRTVRPRDVDMDEIARRLPNDAGKRLIRYGPAIRSGGSAVASSFSFVRLGNDGHAYFMFRYYSTPDSITNNIQEECCIVKCTPLGDIVSYHPIIRPPQQIIYDQSFILKEKEEIFVNTCSLEGFKRDLAKGAKRVNYIARYTLQERRFEYQGLIDLPLPYLHQTKYYENDFSSNFCDFPFVTNIHSNELYNLQLKKRVPIVEENLFRSICIEEESNGVSEKGFACFGIKKYEVDGQTRAVLASRFIGNTWLTVYSPDLKPLRSTLISARFARDGQINWVDIYPPIRQVQIMFTTLGSRRLLVLPSDLFL